MSEDGIDNLTIIDLEGFNIVNHVYGEWFTNKDKKGKTKVTIIKN